MNKLFAVLIFILFPSISFAGECIGDAGYQVCSRSSTESNGDQTISSYDSAGNSYSVTAGSRDNADGSTEVFSIDSDGNEYSIKSWCDSIGCHTLDSDGNKCTVKSNGEFIGC